LGHANYHAISELAAKDRAIGMHGMHLFLSPPPLSCEHCILSKRIHSSVLKVRDGVQAGKKLGIVHVDLLEHPNHISSSRNRYVLNIIDNCSSYCWSIPVAAKSEAFSALQAWEIAREAETGLCVGIL
ncbi:hypothetical protein HD554DRAFT_2012203, partial [Boletus coccyginus]